MASQELILVPASDSDAALWSIEALSAALDLGSFEINTDHGILNIKIKQIETSNDSIGYDTDIVLARLEEKFGVKFILVKRIVDADKRYVRRTAEEFAAGAVPARGGTSHRLKSVGLKLSEDMREAIKGTALKLGVEQNEFMKAAIRQALRDGVRVRYELETPIEVELPEPDEPGRTD